MNEGNNLSIKLMKGHKKYILNVAEYINNGKNLKTKPVVLVLKDKCIALCSEFSFGIISFSNYVHIDTMNIISSDSEINENELLVNK